MCGFFGLLKNKSNNVSRHLFNKSANLISHRGPDSSRYISNKNLYLKFFRLSIIDLTSKAMQPMISKDKRYYLVFNGEIYNAQKLKKTQLKNTFFNSRSDTEVLFKLLIQKKEQALGYLEGMFSFIFFDSEKNEIILARDQFGIKPLYYSYDKGDLIFSSEIKPILMYEKKITLDKKNTFEFFLKGSMDHFDKTFFKSVYSVKPGSYLKFRNGSFKEIKFWDISKNFNTFKSEKFEIKKLSSLISKSIDKHLISDREIGLFLSGGTDSTSLAHLMKKKIDYKLQTFTYGFADDKEFSEYSVANQTSQNLNISNISANITPKFVINNFDNLTRILESPFTSIRLFGTMKLYEEAKRKKLKVIIEGDGGDEAFGGYDYNYIFYAKDFFKKYKFNDNYLNKLINFVKIKKQNNNDRIDLLKNFILTSTFQNGSTSDGTPFVNIDFFKKSVLDSHINDLFYKDFLNQNLNNLQNSQLNDIELLKLPRALKYKDRISMNYGIETRVPFLDHNLFRYAFHLPNKYKIKNLETRYLFKKSLHKISNTKIKFDISKNTIVDPQRIWMKKDLRDFANDHFHSSIVDKIGIFNKKQIIKNFNSFCSSEKNRSSFNYFQILTFIIFYKNFFNKS